MYLYETDMGCHRLDDVEKVLRSRDVHTDGEIRPLGVHAP